MLPLLLCIVVAGRGVSVWFQTREPQSGSQAGKELGWERIRVGVGVVGVGRLWRRGEVRCLL